MIFIYSLIFPVILVFFNYIYIYIFFFFFCSLYWINHISLKFQVHLGLPALTFLCPAYFTPLLLPHSLTTTTRSPHATLVARESQSPHSLRAIFLRSLVIPSFLSLRFSHFFSFWTVRCRFVFYNVLFVACIGSCFLVGKARFACFPSM